MPTLKDFKLYVLLRAGARMQIDFCMRSEAHADFWRNLNTLARPHIDSGQGNKLPDEIDASLELTREQWHSLDTQLDELL